MGKIKKKEKEEETFSDRRAEFVFAAMNAQ
jgi:hypothetical protein